jgi:hypothetical protein
MNIVFLDIDGVLNDFEQSWVSTPDYRPEIVPRCVKAFNQIIRETEARIVLSSAWRHLILFQHMSLHGFQVLLRTHGVRGELIAHTREDRGDEERWAQIADWLRDPRGKGGEKVKVDRYAIIDDTSEAFGGRPGVRTDGAKGLTVANAKRVIRILNGSKVAA